MGELSARNFGLLIAYILPGFVALWGVSLECEPVRLWLFGRSGNGPSAAGIPYTLLASVGAGMAASCIRWALLDTLHHRTGICKPEWDDARLVDRLPAYQLLIEIHYRYYQFYANSVVSGLFAYLVWRWRTPFAWHGLGVDAAFACLLCVFYAGSRDTLRKYYGRTATLLGLIERQVSHDERRTPLPTQDPRTPEAQARSDAGKADDGSGRTAKPRNEDAEQEFVVVVGDDY